MFCKFEATEAGEPSSVVSGCVVQGSCLLGKESVVTELNVIALSDNKLDSLGVVKVRL